MLNREELLHSIVSVLHVDEGVPVGTGFLVDGDRLLTCAHVVRAAEGRPVVGEDEVRIRFEATGEEGAAQILENGWFESEDIAVLRIIGRLPKRARHLALVSSQDARGTTIRSFGYPAFKSTAKRCKKSVADAFVGLWSAGAVSGFIAVDGRTLIQLQTNLITQGFSGAPVWDEQANGVIGIITETCVVQLRNEMTVELALALPAEIIAETCPILQLRRSLSLKIDSADLVAELNMPGSPIVQPQRAFTKTWRIENTGTTTWTSAYRVCHVDGQLFSESDAYPLAEPVEPGATFDLSLLMRAPRIPAAHRTEWRLVNPQGVPFGPKLSVGFRVGEVYARLNRVDPREPVPLSPGEERRFTISFSNCGLGVWKSRSDSPDYVELHACDVNGYPTISPIYPGNGRWIRDDGIRVTTQSAENVSPKENAWFYFVGRAPSNARPGTIITVYFRIHHARAGYVEGWKGAQFTINIV